MCEEGANVYSETTTPGELFWYVWDEGIGPFVRKAPQEFMNTLFVIGAGLVGCGFVLF